VNINKISRLFLLPIRPSRENGNPVFLQYVLDARIREHDELFVVGLLQQSMMMFD
jgi:hypothetical protein